MQVLAQILLLLSTAYAFAFGLYPLIFGLETSRVTIGIAAIGLVLFVVMLINGIQLYKEESKEKGRVATLLGLALTASAILCVRRLKNGHWF